MNPLEQPTLDDFHNQLEAVQVTAVERHQMAIAALYAEHAKRGMVNSGATIRRSLALARSTIEETVVSFAVETRRAIDANLDTQAVRALAEQYVSGLPLRIRELSRLENASERSGSRAVRDAIEDTFVDLTKSANLRWRQFLVGFDKPMAGLATNVVNAENIYGLVQGSPGAQQAITVTINMPALEEALQAAEVSVPTEGELASEIRADLSTIRAQMQKPRPSLVILQEAGRSLRNIGEGIVGGALTPSATQALLALAVALGIM